MAGSTLLAGYPSGTMPSPAGPRAGPLVRPAYAFGHGLDWMHAHTAAPINQLALSSHAAYVEMMSYALPPPIPLYHAACQWVPTSTAAAGAAVTLAPLQQMSVMMPQPDDAAPKTKKRYLHRPPYVYVTA